MHHDQIEEHPVRVDDREFGDAIDVLDFEREGEFARN